MHQDTGGKKTTIECFVRPLAKIHVQRLRISSHKTGCRNQISLNSSLLVMTRLLYCWMNNVIRVGKLQTIMNGDLGHTSLQISRRDRNICKRVFCSNDNSSSGIRIGSTPHSMDIIPGIPEVNGQINCIKILVSCSNLSMFQSKTE